MGRAGVAAVYLVHGTFAGNDALGLLTELERFAPRMTASLRRWFKSAVNAVIGETGNFTSAYAARMEAALSAGAGRPIPVQFFHWSSQNTHIARADGAVRLIDELARVAPTISPPTAAPEVATGGSGSIERPPRILLWGHSHAGNVFALLTNLLGGDAASRGEFFQAAESFYRSRRHARVDYPAWQRVEELLSTSTHPLQRVALDFVTFGTPIRYGWETEGYAKILHVINHRPTSAEREWLAAFPPRLHRVVMAADGDFVQQIGTAGSGFPVIPLALRTFLADRRVRRLFAGRHSRWLFRHMSAGMRVPHEGPTLLVDYAETARFPWTHLFGHALYTRTHWLPLHCELVAREFYGD